jgi:hypothetical protein
MESNKENHPPNWPKPGVTQGDDKLRLKIKLDERKETEINKLPNRRTIKSSNRQGISEVEQMRRPTREAVDTSVEVGFNLASRITSRESRMISESI